MPADERPAAAVSVSLMMVVLLLVEVGNNDDSDLLVSSVAQHGRWHSIVTFLEYSVITETS